MPTPIGHMMTGVTIFLLLPLDYQKRKLLIFVVFFAILPDLDFLLGFISGNPNQFHHFFTHSFFFIVVMAGGIAFIMFKNNCSQRIFYAVLFMVTGFIHIGLDVLALDTSEPFGATIFWPFSQKYFISPLNVFSDVHRSSETQTFIPSLFNMHNLKTLFIEIALLAPFLIIAAFKRKKSHVKFG